MEDNANLLSSDFTFRRYPENFLKEIFNVTPATPVTLSNTETYICDFKPKTGKCYIPKTKSIPGRKVKTVWDIRKSFEQDVYSHLINDLETQETNLLQKNQQGSLRDDKLERNILRGDTPITRSTWQMLMNLNPENQKYLRQYVLANQKYIQVNGSYGGVKKQIMNYDLASKPQWIPSQNYCLKQQDLKRRVLSNFSPTKPGPLCMKKKYAEKHAKTQNLTVVALKLNCVNIEPWCMVHNLYKCFCKGKFTKNYTSIRIESVGKEQGVPTSHAVNLEPSSNSDQDDETIVISDSDNDDQSMSSSRTVAYGRSGSDDCSIIEPTRNINNKTDPGQHLPFQTDNNGSQLLPQSENKMRTLIEHLQMKEQNVLLLPRHGRGKVMFSWNFISRTFQERKHVFIITRDAPYKVYIAVNKTENPYISSCKCLHDVQWADLHKYPTTVQNLLCGRSFNDLYCILRGIGFVWELIYLVKRNPQTNESDKYAEKNTTEMKLDSSHIDTSSVSVIRKSAVENTEQKDLETFNVFDQGNSNFDNLVYEKVEVSKTLPVFNNTLELRDSLVENMEQNDFQDKKGWNQNKSANKSPIVTMEQKDLQRITEKKVESNTRYSDEIGSAKWLVMTIENDFSVIRFQNNFIVNYRTITEAIGDARLCGKTKVIFKKCDKPENPKFGIYAKPIHNDNVVFFGPYNVKDHPRIQIIKTISSVKILKSTRYAWITTNKVDTFNVEENTLLFVPLPYSRTNIVYITDDKLIKDQQKKANVQNSPHIKTTEESKEYSLLNKRKTGGYYHVASDDVKRKKTLQYPQTVTNTIQTDSSVKSSLNPVAIPNYLNRNLIRETSQDQYAETSSAAACQLKISSVFSMQNDDNRIPKHLCNKIFILNPEEINSHLVQNKLTKITLTPRDQYSNNNDETTKLDLLSSVDSEPSTLNDDICVVSDDKHYKTVWIECINIQNLGWIPGIRNVDHFLSFKIPNCEEYSHFYEENKAFTKINVELGKRISGLKDFVLQWKVHESIDQVQGEEINAEKFFPHYVADANDVLDAV